MKLLRLSILALALSLGIAPAAFGQSTGSVGGQVQDSFGAVVVGASITVVAADGKEKTATSNQRGEFAVTGLAPGTYTVKVKATNFALYENTEVAVTAGERAELTVPLTVEVMEENVEVSDSNSVSTDPNNSAGTTVLGEKELDALPDDPDELEAALQALAGASAGPNGGQIYIDGFTGGRLPPKEAIREVRINQNPFSAEYDRLGFGRIEILTRPGSDKFRGNVSANFNDESLNSRNPFSLNPKRAPSQMRAFGGNISGPVIKGKASFFVDVNHRSNDSNAVVNASVLDADLNRIPFQEEFQVPTKRFSISPRFDYAINANNTLVARYSYQRGSSENQGIGNFTLPSRASESSNWEHEFRLTETSIINPTTVNETRFEIDWDKNSRFGDNSIPGINVSEAFSGGGATIGDSFSKGNSWEIQNYTTTTLGSNHSVKFGARVRRNSLTDRSENGFGGSFSFTGAPAIWNISGCPGNQDPACAIDTPALTPLDQYRGTILGLTDNRYYPASYSVTVGNPEQSVSRTDYSLFFTDDWRISPGLTLSAGLRYENQTNMSDNTNFAPRFAIAWSPGAGGAKAPKTVIRGGFGVFYDRFSENTTLTALRFNGSEQLNLIVSANQSTEELRQAAIDLLRQPVFTLGGVTNIPTIDEIQAALPQSNVIRRISSDLKAPVTYQGAISFERQLPARTTFAATYVISQTNNVIRQRNINAPICSDPTDCRNAPVPFAGFGGIYQYESAGTSRTNRLNFNIRSNFSPRYSLFANYSLGFSSNNTDGGFPVYSYGRLDELDGSNGSVSVDERNSFLDEWGRASFDTRHSFVVGGNFSMPWGISLSPFINYNSGRAFNITTGQDENNDLQYNERPTFGYLGDRCDELGLAYSYCDVSEYDPNEIIPRNFGRSPQFVNVNLRVSKTFGFGKTEGSSSARTGGQGGQRGGGGNRGGGGPGGGGRMVMMGGGGGGFFGGGGERKPYNLNLSVNFSNLLNKVNFGAPVGNMLSGRFGQYTSTAGGFGNFGGGGGSANRRIELQARFSW
ncbi:MAG TPA: TonB-dependent receptor [Pyrinomonadaceae bacterium]|nr:TonB-dependent receptor [Pyrinomonadaceae bacterium]